MLWAQSTTKNYIRAEHKLHSISKLFISQVKVNSKQNLQNQWWQTFNDYETQQVQTNEATVKIHSSDHWNKTQITVHSASQHNTTQWSHHKLVQQESQLGAQHSTLYSHQWHTIKTRLYFQSCQCWQSERNEHKIVCVFVFLLCFCSCQW